MHAECIHDPPVGIGPEFRHCQPDFEQVSQTDQNLGLREAFQHFDEFLEGCLIKVEMAVGDDIKRSFRLFDAEGRGSWMHRACVLMSEINWHFQ